MEIIIENEILRVAVSTHGAELTSIFHKPTGAELLWQADPAVWNRHAPILFPYAGRLKNGRFIHKGVSYEGGQHGFARDLEHTLEEKGDGWVTLRLEANALTMPKFPFAFALQTTYRLEGAAVVHEVTVHNDSDEAMPFGLGFHPAFVCPFDAGRAVSDYALRFSAPQSPTVIETGADDGLVTGNKRVYFEAGDTIPLTNTLFAHDSICFTGLTADTLSLEETGTGRGVDVAIAGFPYVLIWSAPGPVKFVCIEPWHSLPDTRIASGEWAEKPAAATLTPGENWITQLKMTFRR